MANHPSALKRHRQSEKARIANRSVRAKLRTMVRQLREAVASGDKAAADGKLREAASQLHKAASKGVLQRILDAIKEGEYDTAVRAFLVVGNGRAFSGGADISEFGLPPVVGLASLPGLASYMDTVTKPIVAAIHGLHFF